MINIFAGHDGVIHDNPQHEDKTEEADQINGHAKVRHEPNRPHQGDGNPHRDPESKRRTEKKGEHKKHEHEAEDGTAFQRIQTVRNDYRSVSPIVNLCALWDEPIASASEESLDRFGNPHRVLLSNPRDLHHDTRLAIEANHRGCFIKAIRDLGDFAQLDSRAVGIGQHHDIAKILTHVCLSFGAKKDVSVAGFNRSGGQINRRARDRLADLAHGQAIPLQSFLRHLDGNFIRSHPQKLRL